MESNVEESIGKLQKMVETNPNNQEARMMLGLAYGTRGRFAEAIKELETAVKIKPEEPEAHFDLGLVYNMMDDLENAVREYKEAVRLKPDHLDALLNLAGVAAGALAVLLWRASAKRTRSGAEAA